MKRRTNTTTTSPRRGALRRIALLCGLAPAMAAWVVAGLWFSAGPAAAAGSGKNGVIVYAAWPSTNSGSQLYSFDPATSKIVDLSGSNFGDDEPAFSPDGKTIAFRNGADLMTMNADGSGRKLLLHRASGSSWPTWSPDGTELAFGATLNGQSGPDVWVMNADGSSSRPVTTTHADDHPVWSPNGTYIAFVSRRGSEPPQIYRMKVDGTGQTNLSHDLTRSYEQPAWSPDSARIVFTSTRDRTGSIGPDLWTMAFDGTDIRTFNHASGSSDGANASYSPDGTEITFAANIGTGGVQLWEAPAGGGTETQLTAYPGNPGVNATSWQQAPASK